MPYLARPIGQVGFSRGISAFGPYGFGQAPAPAASEAMGPQRVYRMTLPEDPEQASMVSLQYIHELVRDGREDPLVRRRAFEVLRQAGVRERDYTGMIRAIHHWVQRHVRYEHDPTGVEFLTQARVLLEQIDRGEAFEDCDSFVLLEHALLNSIGIPTRSIIIAADARAPQQWSHIFLEAYDNKRKRWTTLDPIMKDKPVGWHPPKFFKKRVVPIADGPAQFPPRSGPNGVGQLPPGMTVDVLPTRPARASAFEFFGGTVGGYHGAGRTGWGSWGGFAGYGALPEPEACRWKGELERGADWLEWAVQQVAAVVGGAGLRPQNMDPRPWALHMHSINKGQIGQWQIDAAAQQPGGPSMLFARALFGSVEHWLATAGRQDLVTTLREAATFAEACTKARVAAAQAAKPAQDLQTLLHWRRELLQMRAEALSYVVPILTSLEPLLSLAEHHMGRIAARQAMLKSIHEIAEWTGRALAAIGTVVPPVQLLAIAVQLGDLAYQTRQAGKLASGSAATVLTNISAAFDQGEALVRACAEVGDSANFRVGQVQKAIDAHLAKHPELAPATTLAIATAPLQAAAAWPVLPMVGVAAGLLLLLTTVL